MSTNLSSPQRLYLLQHSTFIVSSGPHTLEMVRGSYLIETGDGKHILIDSGFPADVPESPGAQQTQHEKNVIEHLTELGVHPDDIYMLICTHFDVDHAGYHDSFTKAELIVQREHYALARSGHPRFAAARAHWDHPALNYRLIDGDSELLPGLSVIETSGHTTGHQSVLLHLPQTGQVLLAIDAVVMQRLFTTERRAWPLDEDEEQLRASTRKLLDIVEQQQVALVIFGHDGRQWQTLRKAPEYYA